MNCEWKDLIMSSFEVEKSILEPYLPNDTEIDLFQGKALISLVAFTFSKIKFFGLKIPFHQRFGQMNFRFYAKSKVDGSRGVVFIKVFAPKHLIAFIGNKIYNEPYFFKPINFKKSKNNEIICIEYNNNHTTIKAKATYKTEKLTKNTLKHFIVERYIAYIKNKKNKTIRYNIYHKPWKIHHTESSHYDKELLKLLPNNFKNLKHIATYLVNGSEVNVEKGMML